MEEVHPSFSEVHTEAYRGEITEAQDLLDEPQYRGWAVAGRGDRLCKWGKISITVEYMLQTFAYVWIFHTF